MPPASPRASPAHAPRPARRGHLAPPGGRLGLLQIDSVNVLSASHYLPLFSRLGPYRRALLDGAAWPAPRAAVRVLGPRGLAPAGRPAPCCAGAWRAPGGREGISAGSPASRASGGPTSRRCSPRSRARGPLARGELAGAAGAAGRWWGWSDGKLALEFLFWAGRGHHGARRGFERLYDLPERVLPRAVLAAPTPDAGRRAARAAAHRRPRARRRDRARPARLFPARRGRRAGRVAELVEAGELLPVAVEGWREPAYLDRAARPPRRVEARRCSSPFDSLVWERARTERLFGFRYRIEIYARRQARARLLRAAVPARRPAGRRVDLKADRARRAACACWPRTASRGSTSAPLLPAPCMTSCASWPVGSARAGRRLGERGDLARALLAAFRGQPMGRRGDGLSARPQADQVTGRSPSGSRRRSPW